MGKYVKDGMQKSGKEGRKEGKEERKERTNGQREEGRDRQQNVKICRTAEEHTMDENEQRKGAISLTGVRGGTHIRRPDKP